LSFLPHVAFKEVFEQFAKNSDVSLNEEGLASTLDRVGISISPEEVKKALQKADYDGMFLPQYLELPQNIITCFPL
jgi:Ca2+-binding EF-hand superfamily protein